MNLKDISVVMLTKNSQRFLETILSKLVNFGEIVIVDSGSNDNTLKIASTFKNVVIYKKDFTDFSDMKNFGVDKGVNNIIFSLDSDEIPSDEFIKELEKLNFEHETLYEIDRVNIFNNKKIRCCGWYPDFISRLFDRRYGRFNGYKVHEKIVGIDKNLKNLKLKGEILHYSYLHPRDFIDKMQKYTYLYAEQHKDKKSSISKALTHASFTFFKNYIIQRGFLYGYEGYLISAYNAQCVFWKYVKLIK